MCILSRTWWQQATAGNLSSEGCAVKSSHHQCKMDATQDTAKAMNQRNIAPVAILGIVYNMGQQPSK